MFVFPTEAKDDAPHSTRCNKPKNAIILSTNVVAILKAFCIPISNETKQNI